MIMKPFQVLVLHSNFNYYRDILNIFVYIYVLYNYIRGGFYS